ncbi:MAG: polysaccharide biosynthesis C-terminal domain-containing protein [Bacteroidales bacterium]|nr:polysaccharide biosynthesis C-terminal domain-containing protein [Bacteroidales bacterium]
MSMFRYIIGTSLTRLVNALLSFGILWINTHNLGKEGLGTIGLLVLGITLVLLVSNYIGGGALVFLSSRHDWRQLLVPSYLWAIMVSVAGALLLGLFHLVPEEYVVDVLFLSLLQAWMTVNLNLLIGREKIKLFNAISVIQMVLTTVALAFFIYHEHIYNVKAYIYSLYVGYAAGFLLGLAALLPLIRKAGKQKKQPVIREIIRYGKFIQTANVLQLLNYRLSYYLIEFFTGRAALGIYIVGVQLSEGVWLIGKSVATVQFARISNTREEDYAKRITLLLFKFTFALSLLVTIALVLLPEQVYGWIFGDDFVHVKKVILSLFIGILATSVSLMFSHYFSGMGMPRHNMVGSAIGLVLTLVLGLIFIPKYGIIAAGLTASVSYLANLIYLMVVFIYKTKPDLRDFMIRSDDLRLFLNELKGKHTGSQGHIN